MRHTLGKLKKAKGGSTDLGNRNLKKKKNMPVVDLTANTDAEASSEEDMSGLSQMELRFVETLKLQYSGCSDRKCQNRYCKIDKNSEHTAISWQQMRSWACALVSVPRSKVSVRH